MDTKKEIYMAAVDLDCAKAIISTLATLGDNEEWDNVVEQLNLVYQNLLKTEFKLLRLVGAMDESERNNTIKD